MPILVVSTFDVMSFDKPYTVEDSIKHLAAYGGVFNHSFNDISITSNEATFETYDRVIELDSWSSTYDSASGLVLFSEIGTTDEGIIITRDTSTYPVIKVYHGHMVGATQYSLLYSNPSFAHINHFTQGARITGRVIQLGEGKMRFMAISIYVGAYYQNLVMSIVIALTPQPVGGTYTNGWWPDLVFPINGEVPKSRFSNEQITAGIRIPELTQFGEYTTIDPGETPVGAIQRALEGRYLEPIIRFDNSISAFRVSNDPHINGNSHTISIAEETYNRSVDTRGIYTHVRQIGAYAQAEAHDVVESQNYGHRFIEVQNPFLITRRECLIEAQKQIKRFKSDAHQYSFDAPYVPTLEFNDFVTFVNPITISDKIIVKGISGSASPGVVEMQIDGVLDVWS